jgi:hypothetical protein
MFDAQLLASIAKGESFVAAAVVGHNAGDSDAEAFIISHGRLEKRNGAVGLLVGLDLGEGNAGSDRRGTSIVSPRKSSCGHDHASGSNLRNSALSRGSD